MTISVIIPAYNEEASIGSLLQYLRDADTSPGHECEIIVVDGGSTDNTVRIAAETGARVVESPKKGRAAQMNFGAAQARGDVYYFLHADTYPPQSFAEDIRRYVTQGTEAGCYRLSFDYEHPVLKLYSWFTRFNLDIFRFGDQSLFITKEKFSRIEGYSDQLMVMEDQEVVRRIKDVADFVIMKKPVTTSARKYRDVGIVRLQAIFTAILIMYYLGVSQDTLVRFYRNRLARG